MRWLMGVWAVAVGLGCAEDDGGFVPYEPEPGTPERIAWEAGATDYLPAPAPVEVERDGATTVYTFDPADGPVCMRGDPFAMSVQERSGDDLLIFLQGGGACWSDFCLAITKAQPMIPDNDILIEQESNPVGDYDVVYVPYCDASLFAGDNEVDEDGDGEPDRLHHGLKNLSVALNQGFKHFPSPGKIVLAGSSGGGYGTILASFVVRYVYPDVPIYVLNDAGIGVARSDDTAFVQRLIEEFGARDLIPEDCPDCTADGHITGLVDYLLERDPNLEVAGISSWYDSVISDVFLMTTAEQFAADLGSETAELEAAHPDQYRRYLYPGESHTALLGTVTGIVGRDLSSVEVPPGLIDTLGSLSIESMYELENEGVVLRDWLAAMIADDPSWTSVASEPGSPPVRE